MLLVCAGPPRSAPASAGVNPGPRKRGGSMLSESRPAKVGQWTEPALRVLRERYLTRKDGAVVETPEEMCWRVAQSIAAGEGRYGRSPAALRGNSGAVYGILGGTLFLAHPPPPTNYGKR